MSIIEEKKLSTGAVMTITDESKKLAADRWLVKLQCVVTIPWAEWMDQYLDKNDGSYEDVRTSIEPIMYEMVKERNFIDHSEKEEMLLDIQAKIHENIGQYVDRPDFSNKVFHKQLQEWRDTQRLMASMPLENELGDVEEPDDFSACFK